jgi:hypothetical protein
VIAQLNDLFGEHTFFLDQHGLNIVEPVEAAEPAASGRLLHGRMDEIAAEAEAPGPGLRACTQGFEPPGWMERYASCRGRACR